MTTYCEVSRIQVDPNGHSGEQDGKSQKLGTNRRLAAVR
jgi:hypothetical protein